MFRVWLGLSYLPYLWLPYCYHIETILLPYVTIYLRLAYLWFVMVRVTIFNKVMLRVWLGLPYKL